MLTHEQLRAYALSRAEVKAEHVEQADEFAVLDEILKARAAQRRTPTQVVAAINTTRLTEAATVNSSALPGNELNRTIDTTKHAVGSNSRIADSLTMPGVEDIEFDAPRLTDLA